MRSPKRRLKAQFTKQCHLHAGTDRDDQPDDGDTDDGDTDETSIEPKDIQLVILQDSRSRSKAMPR